MVRRQAYIRIQDPTDCDKLGGSTGAEGKKESEGWNVESRKSESHRQQDTLYRWSSWYQMRIHTWPNVATDCKSMVSWPAMTGSEYELTRCSSDGPSTYSLSTTCIYTIYNERQSSPIFFGQPSPKPSVRHISGAINCESGPVVPL